MYEIFLQLLKNKGVKVTDVCKATGIANSTMTGWKQGKSVPQTETLKKIADYFGVSVSVFFPKFNPEPVQEEEHEEWYYDVRTREMAQMIFDNHQLRALVDAASDATPEDIKTAYDVLMALKLKEAKKYD